MKYLPSKIYRSKAAIATKAVAAPRSMAQLVAYILKRKTGPNARGRQLRRPKRKKPRPQRSELPCLPEAQTIRRVTPSKIQVSRSFSVGKCTRGPNGGSRKAAGSSCASARKKQISFVLPNRATKFKLLRPSAQICEAPHRNLGSQTYDGIGPSFVALDRSEFFGAVPCHERQFLER